MNLSEAKTLFNAGVITKADLYRSDSGIGWCLRFEAIQSTGTPLIFETHRATLRVFKTTDAAFQILERIGFKKAKIFL